MNDKTQTSALLKALISTSTHQEELLRFLPASIAVEVQSLKLAGDLNLPTFFSNTAWMEPIHYSWFSDAIKNYPASVKTAFLKVLTPPKVKGVEQLLGLKSKKGKIPPIVTPFLLEILRKKLQGAEICDKQLLPPSSLNFLLQLERKELIQTADLMGLHDLAADLRQVVDKELLKKTYSSLTQEQLHFLNYCIKQPMRWVPPKLGLTSWDGSPETLKSLIHFRGLVRIAKAIFTENASFIWHFLHRLDTGRAQVIQKELTKKQDLAFSSSFKNQLLHIAKRYQT